MIAALTAAIVLQPLAAAPPPPAAAATVVSVPAGTPIRLATESVIDSRTVQQGQRFSLIVTEDVAVGSRIIFPKGTRAVGEVEAVTGKGMFGKAGSLVLRPLFVELNGRRINLEGVFEQRGKEQVGGAAVTTVITGGLGLIITGKSATVPAGSSLEGRVRDDVTVDWPAR